MKNKFLRRALSRRRTQLLQQHKEEEKNNMLSVKLISTSSSDIIKDIAYTARVSNPGNQNNAKTSTNLVRYLIKHKHWSPFEMANICLEIDTTREMGRELLRHRSFSFQEFSQRYADFTDLGTFQYKECRLQDPSNRQNSVRAPDGDLHYQWLIRQRKVAEDAMETYKWALNRGIAKECARAVLPEGLTPTRLYMQGSVRSWIHYIEVRTAEGVQKEHVDIAKACAETISPVFPMIKNFICLTSV